MTRNGTNIPVINAVILDGDTLFVAECLEVAVVTQGKTLDETLRNLRDALKLHLDHDERAAVFLPSRGWP